MVASSQGTSFNMFLLTMKDSKGLSLIECVTCFELGKTISNHNHQKWDPILCERSRVWHLNSQKPSISHQSLQCDDLSAKSVMLAFSLLEALFSGRWLSRFIHTGINSRFIALALQQKSPLFFLIFACSTCFASLLSMMWFALLS